MIVWLISTILYVKVARLKKVHTTAVVMCPPIEIRDPTQVIRRKYDRNVNRWMPHVTLLYPFAPFAEFDGILDQLSAGCRAVLPFEVALQQIRSFDHGQGRHTIWLDPEPAQPIDDLQRAVWSQLPDYDDVRSFQSGFTPHLSVGQAKGEEACVRIEQELRQGWSPLTFTADRVALIWRNDPPDDVFRVYREIALGTGEVLDPAQTEV